MEPQKYQKLRGEIIKTVPEILALEPGCRVKSGGFGEYEGVICGEAFNKKLYMNLTTMEALIRDFEPHEILGRDITLEDIMIVLNEKFPPERDCIRYLVTTGGTVTEAINSTIIINKAHWVLGQPLHLQPEEYLESLYNLIVKQ